MNIDIIIDTLNAMERKTKDSKEKITLRAVVELLHCVDSIGFNLWTIEKLVECVEKELCEKYEKGNEKNNE